MVEHHDAVVGDMQSEASEGTCPVAAAQRVTTRPRVRETATGGRTSSISKILRKYPAVANPMGADFDYAAASLP